MAKFTKLNIGDSVASGGGRVWKKLSVEEEVTLEGTWIINDTFTKNDSVITIDDIKGTFNVPTTKSVTALKSVSIARLQLTSYDSNAFGVFCKEGTTNFNGNVLLTPTGSCNCYCLDGYSATVNTSNSFYESLRTISITSNVAEITNGDTLLAWLKANATKQGAKPLISFTIAGTSYQAEDGMTWSKWVASKYNTNGVKIDSQGNVLASSGLRIATAQYSGNQYSTDTIVANTSYIVLQSDGAD